MKIWVGWSERGYFCEVREDRDVLHVTGTFPTAVLAQQAAQQWLDANTVDLAAPVRTANVSTEEMAAILAELDEADQQERSEATRYPPCPL